MFDRSDAAPRWTLPYLVPAHHLHVVAPVLALLLHRLRLDLLSCRVLSARDTTMPRRRGAEVRETELLPRRIFDKHVRAVNRHHTPESQRPVLREAIPDVLEYCLCAQMRACCACMCVCMCAGPAARSPTSGSVGMALSCSSSRSSLRCSLDRSGTLAVWITPIFFFSPASRLLLLPLADLRRPAWAMRPKGRTRARSGEGSGEATGRASTRRRVAANIARLVVWLCGDFFSCSAAARPAQCRFPGFSYQIGNLWRLIKSGAVIEYMSLSYMYVHVPVQYLR